MRMGEKRLKCRGSGEETSLLVNLFSLFLILRFEMVVGMRERKRERERGREKENETASENEREKEREKERESIEFMVRFWV